MTSRRVAGLAVTGLIAIGLFPVVSTQWGANAVAMVRSFLEFYSGVFALLAFTASVIWGLSAAERILPARHRILAQGIHRMFGVLGLGFLGTHIVLQILAERAGIIDAVVPFLDYRDGLIAIGLGTIASDLMVVVFSVGVIRWRFATSSRPWLWRVLHGIAYLAWPAAIVHGLSAGRSAATWVTASYLTCLCAVLVALLVRLVRPFPATRSARRVRAESGRDIQPQRTGWTESPVTVSTGPQPTVQIASRPAVNTGPQPQPRVPQRPTHTGPQPAVHAAGPPPGGDTGPRPRVDTGPQPSVNTGPLPTVPGGPSDVWRTGPQPTVRVASQPAVNTGPQPDVPPQARGGPPSGRPPQRDDELDMLDVRRRPRYRSDRRQRSRAEKRQARELFQRRISEIDSNEVEFWAALRAETAGWIRRGRR